MTIAISHTGLLAIGILGQALFSARFLVQWLASEWRRASVMPTAFWWLSILGGVFLLIYAIARRDPVFIAGQGFGLLVYLRNLVLIRRRGRAGAKPETAAGAE